MDAAAGQDLGEESESRKGKATVISGDSGSLVGNGALNMTCEDSQRISKEIEDLRAQIDKDVKEFGYCEANKKLRVELALKVKEIQCLRKQYEEIQAKYDGMIKSNGNLQAKTDGLAKHNEELQAKNDRLVKEYEEPVCSVPTVSAGTAPMAVDTPCPAAVEDASVGPSGGTAELGGGFPPPELAPSSSGICAAISGETSEEALWDEMQSNLASTATGLRALADDLKARVAEISNGFQAQVTALQKDKSAALKEKLEAEAVCASLSAKVTRLQVETKKQ